jgi:hypothetical protein
MAVLNEGFSSTLSLRAFTNVANSRGSLTQLGINPQRTSASSRSPSASRPGFNRTIATGSVGAIFWRGGAFAAAEPAFGNRNMRRTASVDEVKL